jgi:MOSC domain-containing protein YiiM
MWCAGREVLLVDEELLEAAGMQVGGVKENITVRGVDLGQAEPGTRFKLGADLEFEVGQKLACVGEDPALTGKRGTRMLRRDHGHVCAH